MGEVFVSLENYVFCVDKCGLVYIGFFDVFFGMVCVYYCVGIQVGCQIVVGVGGVVWIVVIGCIGVGFGMERCVYGVDVDWVVFFDCCMLLYCEWGFVWLDWYIGMQCL